MISCFALEGLLRTALSGKPGLDMKTLSQGVHQFQKEVFGAHQELFAKLESGQTPHTLFITCSDSRINPNMLTQTGPGEIFILRNAGNIIPKYNDLISGEAASIEFAVAGLGIEHIVVCGHSNCGAMKAILDPKLLANLPALTTWLAYAGISRHFLHENYVNQTDEEYLNLAVQENVLAQLDNLRTHPVVADRLSQGKLHLYGWVYKILTGQVFAYDPIQAQFNPLVEINNAMPKPFSAIKDENPLI